MSQQIDDLFDVFEDTNTSLPDITQHQKVDHFEADVKRNIERSDVLNGTSNKDQGGIILTRVSQVKSKSHEEYNSNDTNQVDNKQGKDNLKRKNDERVEEEEKCEKEGKGVVDSYNADEDDNFNIRLVVGGQELETIVSERVKSKIYGKEKTLERTKNGLPNRKKIRKLENTEKTDDTNEKEQVDNGEHSDGYFCPDIRDLLVQELPIEYSSTLKDGDSLVLEEFLSDTNCMHKCVRPKNYVHTILTGSSVPARTYKFRLDTFQRKSIECLERGESVLVSAHTSAGKTVIAEYAIALGLRDKQRVIYTSPIKALSNQKYRDLQEEFEDVGLITGDISINPDASIIVMTTEILRSMLYRGSALTKEVRWVIFDEIHYMRDRERGVIWEETIILLPLMVRFIFLSATIPNGIQFAEWVSTIKNQACHIIYTDYRPTPLQHYAYPSGKESVILICDEHGQFLKENFMEAANAVNDEVGNQMEKSVNALFGGNKRSSRTANKNMIKMKKKASDIEKIVKMCHCRHYTPLIVFAFSKKECEMNANSIAKIDLTNQSEKTVIQELFKNAIQILSDDDRNLPQIKYILPLLMRGIGIHHGGLLPIVKEIIEIMFQESLLKVLFSTETFSMGINMPAKTVVFTALEKFDGVEKRAINSGEYIQMAGRAGRRGLDDRGIVIILLDKYIHWKDAEQLFIGESNRLNSQFHLGYNMILNLLRIEGITPDYMIERSFLQYQAQRNMYEQIAIKNKIEQEMRRTYATLSSVYVDDEGREIQVPSNNSVLSNHSAPSDSVTLKDVDQAEKNTKHLVGKQDTEQHTKRQQNKMLHLEELRSCSSVFSCVSQYYNIKKKLLELGNRYRQILTQQKVIIPFLCKGRLVFIEEKGIVWGWCVFIEGRIIRSSKRKTSGPTRNDRKRKVDNQHEEKNKDIDDGDGDGVVVIDCWVPYIPDKKRKLEQEENGTDGENMEIEDEEEEEEEEEDKENDGDEAKGKKGISNCSKKRYVTHGYYQKEKKQKNKKGSVCNTTNSFADSDEMNNDITTINEEDNILDFEEMYEKYGCSELDDICAMDDFEDEIDGAFLNTKNFLSILAYPSGNGRPVPPSQKQQENVQWKKMTFFLKSVCRLSAAILSVPSDTDVKCNSGASVIKERYNALIKFVKKEKYLPVITANKLKFDSGAAMTIVKNIRHYEQLLLNNKLRKNKKFYKFYLIYIKYVVLQFQKNEVDNAILKFRNIVLKKDLKKMLNLLENMKYIEVTYRLNYEKQADIHKELEQEQEKESNTKMETGTGTGTGTGEGAEAAAAAGSGSAVEIKKQKTEHLGKKKEEEKEKEEEEEEEKEGNTHEIGKLSEKQENKITTGKGVEEPLTEHKINSLYEYQEMTKNMQKEKKTDQGYIVTMKGQIASAISSVDELVIAELFFSNFFSQYGSEYIAAFLSCFVFDENKTTEVPILDNVLVQGHKKIIETAKRIAREMERCDMEINFTEYLAKFKPEIMTTVLNWMKGFSFSQLQIDSHIYEGSIIRTLRRLDELLRQMICAFKGINNDDMCQRLLKASKTLRRGIPFSPSLYL